VKVVIEGEEEIGSTHLSKFLQAFRDELSADILVLTDTANFDCGVPALTIALRGMVGLEVEVKSLSKTIHSGMWGGPIPDPVMALSKMLATLVDENGQIAISGVLDRVKSIAADEAAQLARIPYEEAEFRAQSGMLPETQFLKTDPAPIVQVWRLPSLTVNAIQASSRKNAGNIINDTAWAKVTIRLVADMDPEEVLDLLKKHLQSQVPWGLELEMKTEVCTAHGRRMRPG
jgi:acetylornithine deacetylase/succinyl-diaminopimelate desuccinylase-like protein